MKTKIIVFVQLVCHCPAPSSFLNWRNPKTAPSDTSPRKREWPPFSQGEEEHHDRWAETTFLRLALQLSFFSLRLQTNFIKTLQHSSHDVKIQKHFKAFIYFIHLFYNIHNQCVKRWHWEILFMFKKCLITCNPLKGKSFHWCISVAPYSPTLIS